jgi:dolichyl-phosphate beta-glucosyltransferase
MKKDISIIIPAFNEEDRLEASIVEVLSYVKDTNLDAEVIVVDDGSSDKTSEITKSVFSRSQNVKTLLINYDKNKGKGFAVKKGLLAANGDIGVFMDADLSTPISEIQKLIQPIIYGEQDVTFGSRALNRELIGNRQSWQREQSGKVFNLIVRMLTGLPFCDTQCGFKAFKMSKFRSLLDLMTIERFGFDVEFLYVANFKGLRLKEVPVRWNHCDGTKVSAIRDSHRMFNEVRQIRRNARNGVYEINNYQDSRDLFKTFA